MRIAVLTGGSTPERDVAFAGAAQVVAALRQLGHEVTTVDTTAGQLSADDEARLLVSAVGREPPAEDELRRLEKLELGPALVALPAVRDADLVFPVLHGEQGEGGALQALLELAGVPYAGSGPLGSALAMDKDVAKHLFRAASVPTPDWRMWPVEPAAAAADLGLPLVVKPVKAGSTVGLTIVRDAGNIEAAVRVALAHDDEVMLETFLPGREFTVGILGERALAVGEIIPSHEIFDYECKYTPGLCREVFPAEIPDRLAGQLREAALAAHKALKLRDFSRVDFRVTPSGTMGCLEANTLPGVTRMSLFPQSAAAVGIDFPGLCEAVVRLALARTRRGNKVQS
jgi:D-alanine-D-alanine ligase